MARQGAVCVEELIRNKVSRFRRWKLTHLGKKRPKWGFKFTFMTYNILSQTAVDCHLHLYRQCDPRHLNEEYRASRILPEILGTESDVVCLQEVEQRLYDQRIRGLFESNGFGSVFKKRTGGKSDGCAILWRRSKFSLLEHREVEYQARGGCELLNRDNVGLIAVLRPNHPEASRTRLHVATTHLIFNPRRGDVKLCQLRLLVAELERLALKEAGRGGRIYHPTILCGDFNFEPHSPLYEFVENSRLDVGGLVAGNMSGQHEGTNKGGRLDGSKLSLDGLGVDESGRFSTPLDDPSCSGGTEKHGSRRDLQSNGVGGSSSRQDDCFLETIERLKDLVEEAENKDSPTIFYHDFNFMPAYKYHHQDRRSQPVTSMTGGDCNTVDHIFYNVREKNPAVEDRLKLLATYSLPRAQDLREIGGLPNAHLGSDHLNLMSKFVISFK